MNSENLQRLRDQVDVLLNFISDSNMIKELENSMSESEAVEVSPEISSVQFNLISSNSPFERRRCSKVFTVCPTDAHDSSPCTHAVDCRTGELL